MTPVIPGRFTAQMDEPVVVFLTGMRVNRPLAFGKWIATARAMGPMVRELQQHPQKGLLGVEQFFYWPGAALVQYWRSFEDLERFARNPDEPHLPAWQRFNRTVGSDGSVGIFHETYIVERGNYEAIYGNTADFSVIDPYRIPRTDGSAEKPTRPVAHAWCMRVNINATR